MTATTSLDAQRRAPFRLFTGLLIAVLGGYLFFNRTFAWLHVPGIPVFLGEVVVLVGVYEAVRWGRVAAMVRRSAPLKLLAAFMAIGLVGLAWGLPSYGLDAVRDSAIWYYGALAFLVAAALAADPETRGRLLSAYRRAVPWFLLWAPVAVVLSRGLGDSVPDLPDSKTSLLAFKSGDFAVHAALAVAFLWLAEERPQGRAPSRVPLLTALGLVGVAVAGSQNRGGLLAALTILLIAMVFLRERGKLVYAAVFTLGGLLVVALALDLRVDLGKREVSAQQMFENAQSVLGGGESDELTGTVAWRLELWEAVLDDVVYGDLFVTGWGFGPNLGEIYGVAGESEQPLRNPHNSHLTVLGRMGVTGAVAWSLLWIVWLGAVGSRITPRHHVLPGSRAALAAWALAAVVGMLVNAVFDPTLEGPQVGLWFWSFVGFGVALMSRPERSVPAAAGLRAPLEP